MIKLRPWEKKQVVWLVWAPERGETEDDAREVEALDAEQAADDFAEWDDNSSAEYSVARGEEITVHARARHRTRPSRDDSGLLAQRSDTPLRFDPTSWS